MTRSVPPLLVFGWGNLSRGDDALGPLFIKRLCAVMGGDVEIEFLDDYQLQLEHALDLVGREHVLFVDASLNCSMPFEASALSAAQDASFTTHTMSPQSLMHVYRTLQGEDPPPCTLLAIRGERFDLGQPPSPAALEHLAAALQWAHDWLVARTTEMVKTAKTARA